MRLAQIQIKNLLGITDATINPDGNIVEISGGNGVGKTSTLESVKAALGISDYKTLLRNGEDSGEVLLDLGDLQVRRRFTEKGDTLQVKGKVMGTSKMTTLGSPASILKGLVNPESVNPVQLLTAKPKELVDAVLKALPMTVTEEQMVAIIGEDHNRCNIDLTEHALVVIGKMQKEIELERRDVNRDIKTGNTSITELEATLPEGGTDADEIQDEIEATESKLETINGKARRARRRAVDGFDDRIEDKKDDIQDLENRINDLQMDLAAYKAELAALEQEAESAGDAAEQKVRAEGTVLNETLKRLNQDAMAAAAANQTVARIHKYKDTVATAQKASNEFSAQLDALQGLKVELCSDLPIEGLAIVDGRLTMNGIPFETLNTAARIDLVIELAKLSAGDLGLVILDNSEMLSDDTYAEFRRKAGETDLTFLVARVTEGDLQVES